jgi:hypothetical protein
MQPHVALVAQDMRDRPADDVCRTPAFADFHLPRVSAIPPPQATARRPCPKADPVGGRSTRSGPPRPPSFGQGVQRGSLAADHNFVTALHDYMPFARLRKTRLQNRRRLAPRFISGRVKFTNLLPANAEWSMRPVWRTGEVQAYRARIQVDLDSSQCGVMKIRNGHFL